MRTAIVSAVAIGAAIASLVVGLVVGPGARARPASAPRSVEGSIEFVRKDRLMRGVDDIDVTLEHKAAIDAFRSKTYGEPRLAAESAPRGNMMGDRWS